MAAGYCYPLQVKANLPIESQTEKFQNKYYATITRCHVAGSSTIHTSLTQECSSWGKCQLAKDSAKFQTSQGKVILWEWEIGRKQVNCSQRLIPAQFAKTSPSFTYQLNLRPCIAVTYTVSLICHLTLSVGFL